MPAIMDSLRVIAPRLNGSVTALRTFDRLVNAAALPAWIIPAMTRYPLAGARFLFPPGSRFGDWWIWMDPAAMERELCHAHGGRALIAAGLFPIGSCAWQTGEQIVASGDPLCIEANASDDSPLVSISHEEDDAQGVRDSAIVAEESIAEFLLSARVLPKPHERP